MSWFPGHCCWIFMGNGVRPMAKKKRFCGYLLTLTTGIRRFFTEVCRWLAAGENRSFPFWGGRIYWDGQGHIHGVSLNIVLLREVLKKWWEICPVIFVCRATMLGREVREERSNRAKDLWTRPCRFLLPDTAK